MKQQNFEAPADYNVDFYEWTQQTGELLRQGRTKEIDLEHVADEITDMGKRDYREIRSRLTVLILHLLKWQAQASRRQASSWAATIDEQRIQLTLVLSDSPSLSRFVSRDLPLIYRSALRKAIRETKLPAEAFPSNCPYTVEEILDEDFLPDGLFDRNN